MPYIITMKQPFRPSEWFTTSRGSTHITPASETRQAAPTLAGLNALCIEHGATGLTTGELRKLVNKGGIIGPLPDETTIEVTLIEWPALAKVAGMPWITYEPSSDHLRNAIIDAYNKETA